MRHILSHCHRRRPERRHGLHRLQRLPISGDATRSSGGADPRRNTLSSASSRWSSPASRSTSRSRPIAFQCRRARISAISGRSPDEVGYVFYVDPGPEPGTSVAYWGPRSKWACRKRRSALTWTRRPTSRASRAAFNSQGKVLPIVYHPESANTRSDSDPDPGHHAAQPAARVDPADPAEH